MAEKRLNQKQTTFCKLIVDGLNGTQAYKQAFGSSDKVAGVNASRLLKKPAIQAQIAEFQLQNKQITKAANDRAAESIAIGDIMDVAERKKVLTQIARGEIKLNKPMVVNKEVQLIECVPDYSDRKSAIAELNRMDGDYAPSKVAQTDKNGNDVQPITTIYQIPSLGDLPLNE